MLVLSRGRNDRVVFPSLGITVEILRVDGKKVRLGIDAPRDVPVLRSELAARDDQRTAADGCASPGPGLNHDCRNRLHRATLGLRLLQKMLEQGRNDDAEATILKTLTELKSLEAELRPNDAGAVAGDAPAPGRRALIVDDDRNESELLAGYLRLCGYEVSTAMDGLQAMVHLSSHERPDVVLLDMKMPRCDGRKTVAAIRQSDAYRTLKVFAVTGVEQDDSQVEVGPSGVDRWFTKPVDPARLVQAIRDETPAEFVSA